MNKIELKELVGGALQDKFQKSFEKVIENLQMGKSNGNI